MNIHELLARSERAIRSNAPAILTAFGVAGTVTTAYFAGRASWKAHEIIMNEPELNPAMPRKQRVIERTRVVWKLYVPAALSGGITIGCIIGATRVGNRRTAAIAAAYSLSERAFSEYRDEVANKFGAGKEQAVRDELAQKRVDANPVSNVVVTGGGTVLCYETLTGRYFYSDMETIRRAVNDINAKMISHTYVYLSDFYDLIGLGNTSMSNYSGWEADKLLELQFSTVLSAEGKPCLSFEYNYIKSI